MTHLQLGDVSPFYRFIYELYCVRPDLLFQLFERWLGEWRRTGVLQFSVSAINDFLEIVLRFKCYVAHACSMDED